MGEPDIWYKSSSKKVFISLWLIVYMRTFVLNEATTPKVLELGRL
jgi:hypothetical protein